MKSENLRLVLMSCCAPCSAGAIRQLKNIIDCKHGLNSPSTCGRSGRERRRADGVGVHISIPPTLPRLALLGTPSLFREGEFSSHPISDFIVLFFNPNIFPESEYQKRLAEQIRLCKDLGVKYAIGEYNHAQWRNCILGFEDEPERGKRCSECFKMRIKWGANWARENGYDALATVFGVSKYKDQIQVDLCAASTLEKIIYLPIKWDEDLRISENKKYDFYRQKYCGCEFSLKSDM